MEIKTEEKISTVRYGVSRTSWSLVMEGTAKWTRTMAGKWRKRIYTRREIKTERKRVKRVVGVNGERLRDRRLKRRGKGGRVKKIEGENAREGGKV